MPVKEKPDTSQTMSFWEHLDVMRGYLLRMAVVILALFLVAFCFKGTLFDIVLAPRDGGFITYRLINRVASSLGLSIKVAIMSEVLANFSNVNKGIGSLIVLSQQYAVMPDLIAYSLLAIVVSFAFDFASFLFRRGARLIENRKELSEKKDDRLE